MGITIPKTAVGPEPSGGRFPHLRLGQQAQHRTKPHPAERGQCSKDRLSASFGNLTLGEITQWIGIFRLQK